MAKNEAHQSASDESVRVYKASDVHKRRAETRASLSQVKAEEASVHGDEDSAPGAAHADLPVEESETKKLQDSQKPRKLRDSQESQESIKPSESSEPQQSKEPSESQESLESSEGDETSTEDEAPEPEGKPKKKRLWKLVVSIVVGIIVAALLVAVGFLAGSRWLRFNDGVDLQGNWYVYGTNVPLAITDAAIVINDQTSYAYRIDPTAKTIEYSFGNMKGQGRYWFSDDRKTLVITDGTDYTMWSTLFDDLSYSVARLFGRSDLPTSETSIVLSRSIVQAPAPGDEAPADTSSAASTKDELSDELKVSDIMMKEDDDGTLDEQAG